MLLNLQNSCEDRECMHYSHLNFNSFLPIGYIFPGISQDYFEKRQIAACRFSKELCANPRNMYINLEEKRLLSAVFKEVL
jgi:hypothetical protein